MHPVENISATAATRSPFFWWHLPEGVVVAGTVGWVLPFAWAVHRVTQESSEAALWVLMALRALWVLQALAREDARAVQPPTVYRALEFLREAGLVHRIDTLNAFIGCGRPGEPHGGQMLVCRECKSVEEVNDSIITGALAERAAALGFLPDAGPLEIKGLCPACRQAAAGTTAR